MAKHFGHFLIESVARLWPVLPGGELEDQKVVFSICRDDGYAAEWIRAAGVDVIEPPGRGITHFTNISIPEPSMQIAAWGAAEIRDIHLHAGGELEKVATQMGDNLWLSRSQLGPGQGAHDELLFEWVIAPHIRAVHPEQLSLAEQVSAVEAANTIVGVIGSAFHTLLMAATVPRYVGLSGETIPSAYVIQDALCQRRGTFVHALAPVDRHRRKRRFPNGMRLLIPEAIQSLYGLGIDRLQDDRTIAALATPGRLMAIVGRQTPDRDLLVAVAAMLLNPNSHEVRMRLCEIFEERELFDLALEQYAVVVELEPSVRPTLLRVARLWAHKGYGRRASILADYVLAAEPSDAEAAEAEDIITCGLPVASGSAPPIWRGQA